MHGFKKSQKTKEKRTKQTTMLFYRLPVNAEISLNLTLDGLSESKSSMNRSIPVRVIVLSFRPVPLMASSAEYIKGCTRSNAWTTRRCLTAILDTMHMISTSSIARKR